MDQSKPAYTIPSFVGGGIRGLLPATILARLDAAHNGDLNRTKTLAGCAISAVTMNDLLGGKSLSDLVNLSRWGNWLLRCGEPKRVVSLFPISHQAIEGSIKDRQLWNLVSAEELGYFFIQNKY